MLTQITRADLNWEDVKNKCRTTVGKEYSPGEPSDRFKWQLLVAEHSPIRLLSIHWHWEEIYSWAATHWSRHKWECFISTRRSDRTGVDRGTLSQNELVSFDGVANAQHLIDTMRKRLCCCASTQTRIFAYDLKLAIIQQEPALGAVLVPNCIYRCGCPEMKSCGFFQRVLDAKKPDVLDIAERYDAYNEYFLGV